MSSLVKMLILVVVVLGLGAGLVFWKTNHAGGHGGGAVTKVSKEDMEIFLETALNPMQLRMLAQSPDQKKALAKNLAELLSLSNQARKEGYADKPEFKKTIKDIRKQILAINYDKEINAGKGQMPPFSFITEDQIKAFWEETEEEKTGVMSIWKGADKRRHIKEFETGYDEQIKLAKERGLLPKEGEPNEEQKKQIETQRKQMRDSFAKVTIYYAEAKAKLASIGSMTDEEKEKWEKFERKVNLQIMLQESQTLVQAYVQEVLAPKLEVKKEDVEKYIADHPELGKEKRDKAEEVLKKVKDGEDFAKLAKEYSEDPGSKDTGGLYKDVPLGQMAKEFETAALALEPGKVADKLVKTNFGYHIIKLERKGETEGKDGKKTETYDARHILISSKIKDPSNPVGQEVPIEQYVNQTLSKEKQEKVIGEIVANNPVEVAEDFEVKIPPVPPQPQTLPGVPPPPAQGQGPRTAPQAPPQGTGEKK